MPKYYCEYCDIYLTHSSPAGRRQHANGRRHINNKIEYYNNLMREKGLAPPAYAALTGPMNPAAAFGRGMPMILRPGMRPPTMPMAPGMPGRPMFSNMSLRNPQSYMGRPRG
ncbi:unnamed protein product [Vitrella brassicaformis CCMP3155]|uniref:Matrin-type domain-containing protein n=1 Tax=Vitrella brassicaformis (strain CCMP3155) TaxID=1169540 RepID=A0A0G4EAV9_VITBC|nr:unnamed protein product [Vitrella brassicaformis CCMP3155]|mmetsp:Transcript_51068/g.128151  ORF Transcript_51068/g.128151 Transcript_51068/m.128151 type:complete len:112 (-) Transcript_51068:1079-1414(-)|eukprot:CEL92424.1 unnamed protein product [Vitrella brassicaformis CCMP3155]